MKLLKSEACHPASDGGNVKRMTVMGETWMDRLSDAGSIPARSMKKRGAGLFFSYIFRSLPFPNVSFSADSPRFRIDRIVLSKYSFIKDRNCNDFFLRFRKEQT